MMKTLITRLLALVLLASYVIFPANALAITGADFKAGRIIDDVKFFSSNTMSALDIQRFLNAKVPVCDTNGTQVYSGAQTRAQFSATRGISTPFTCLKDFQTTIPAKIAESGLCEDIQPGNATGAEIIKIVAVACGINPQALIVLLQKEQSLITDDWQPEEKI